ncbi:MAG: CBS domain-containing protein [Anaerolineales bacterium]|nr:CBS domain-containing protein [Anaerolineales bacterium]
MLVGKRMKRNPLTIQPDVSIAEALEKMRREKMRHFPVLDKQGHLVGIVSRQDLLYAAPSSVTSLNVWEVTYLVSQVKVKEVMTRDVITAAEDLPVEDAARIMSDNKIGCLPVVRNGLVVGIITETDLFNIFLELFEARQEGIRLTVLAPYFKGSLAQITSTITEHGGLILALNTFLGEDPSNWGCTLKVADMGKDELLDVVKPLVIEVVDVREIK